MHSSSSALLSVAVVRVQRGGVPDVGSGCRGGGNAVVLDGVWLSLRVCRGGTPFWTHPCSWTQRHLSKSPIMFGLSAVGLSFAFVCLTTK